MSDELHARVAQVFGPLVVNKRAALLGGLERTPRFVTEYLIASAKARRADVELAEVRERIRRFSIDADRKNEFISRMMRDGNATLITLLEVEPVPDRNEHIARVAQLDGHVLNIKDEIIAANPELLYGGMWGSVGLRYDTSGAKPTMVVDTFTPYQLARPDTEAFRKGRARFSFDEWVDVMVTSTGYNPLSFATLRQKLLLLTRLVPLAESNVNLVELGPRNTGKSYLLRNLSSRVYLSSGARATPASLFYDLNKKRLGLLGVKKAVIFDEVNATAFPDPAFVAGLLDYMESGSISRGGRSMTSDCSLVFTGNIDLSADGVRPRADYPHLFAVLPKDLCTPAFVDRVHGFLPGWELPKISDHLLTDGVGFLSDYFGEVLTELRRDPTFADSVRARLDGLRGEGGDVTIRDKKAIERLMNGLTRILFPDGRIDPEGFEAALRVAIELRSRVHKQLTKMAPGEFKEKAIHHGDSSAPRLPEEQEKLTDELDRKVNTEPTQAMVTMLYVYEGRGGGDRGFVQCSHLPGRNLAITGLRGLVLEESIKAAYDALLHLSPSLGLSPERLRARKMSVHLVNIADNRDGPSAGVAFALAMLSAVTGRAVRPALAVTGELALHGNILAVGGIPEKLHAALRHGRKMVLIPEANREDLRQIPEVTSKIDVRPVRTLEEAVDIALEEAR
ncbi:BREX system Lon protease-like protein BrxL [Sorangium sp. So ce542]|uniref:BREX system Lon protease-like protein BrxL n=1 Tax=Sorangium sp. So ce542 TaxID=3133316 RepID=UPI003F60C570